ncbi:MAG TPA: PIN domain-containing protein [Thermoanaerobaculia bacterium]|nr:PIN domain-containing protein [Thermoanaerobaculia bacterium]
MRVLFDTSVLVPAVVQAHSMHERALPWLMRVQSGEIELALSCHGLAELYSTLTRLPVTPRITPARATQLVLDISALARHVVPLVQEDYLSTILRISSMGLSGSLIYDALIARAAEKAGAEHLLTFNESHFRRVWPEGDLLVP